MTEVHIKPEELKKLVMMGKKRTMFYGFNPGKKNPDLLLVDRKKTGEMLGRIVKKEGEGTKVSFGKFNLDGRKMTVRTPQYIQGLAKLLRKHLKTVGLSLGVEVLDTADMVLESDLADDGAETSNEVEASTASKERAETTSAEPAPPEEEAAEVAEHRAAITERVRALQAPVAALGASGAPIKKAIAAVVGLIKEGALDKAQIMLDRIEEAAAKAEEVQPAPAKAGEADANKPQELLGRAGEVKKRLDALPEPIAEAVKKKLIQAIELVRAGDFAAAETGLLAAEHAIEVVTAREAAAAQKSAEEAAKNVPNAAQDDLDTQETAGEADPIERSDNVEEVVPEPESAPAEEPQVDPVAQTEWETIIEPLRAEVEAALNSNMGDVTSINLAFAAAQDQAQAGDFKAALKSAETLQNLLNEAADAPEPVAEVDPQDTQAYEKLRAQWEDTRNALFADLERLKLAIQAKANAVDGLTEIAENADVLHGYLEELDGSLDDALIALMRSKDTNEAERLKKEALASVNAYRSTLDSDFFQAVDQNGFTKTEIRGKALDTLSGVEDALAA